MIISLDAKILYFLKFWSFVDFVPTSFVLFSSPFRYHYAPPPQMHIQYDHLPHLSLTFFPFMTAYLYGTLVEESNTFH